MPAPPPTTWEPNKTYTYQRTIFIPIYPYVGQVQVAMGLYPPSGKGERVGLKGEDAGPAGVQGGHAGAAAPDREHLPGLQGRLAQPGVLAQNPSLERTWTKKDALVPFKNPKKDVVVYLEADTNYKAFDAPPVLTLAVGNKSGLVIPIENSEVFLKKMRVKAADLGNEEWVDLRLAMNQSFVPKAKGVNTHDDRELGVMVYHLYVGEADTLGTVPQVVDAGPVHPPRRRRCQGLPAKAGPTKGHGTGQAAAGAAQGRFEVGSRLAPGASPELRPLRSSP